MARTDTASRVIAAPPDRVYAALVDPEALTTWLPPDGMSGRYEWFGAKPGGSYRLVLTYPDASAAPGKTTADSDIVEAHFVEIVAGVRVVQAVNATHPHLRPHRCIRRVTQGRAAPRRSGSTTAISDVAHLTDGFHSGSSLPA